MKKTTFAIPAKRNVVLYARVTEKNKTFLAKAAKKEGVSESALVDHVLDWYRNASNKRKSK